MTAHTIAVGADPEMFLQDRSGSFVSAYGTIPGTKEDPHKVDGGAVQVDGMAVEFNIDPALTKEEFIGRIRQVRDQLGAMLPDFNVIATPVARFSPEYMRTQCEAALELGCDPDFNAYTKEANPRPDGDVPFRTAGGHVHVGWIQDMPLDDPDHVEACQMLTRELDFYLGVASLFWDNDDQRRNMYGAPGAYRVKSYGVEYRSLSNAWLNDERIQDFVYTQVQRAFTNLANGESWYNLYNNVAQQIIEGNDRVLARILLEEHPAILGDHADLIREYMNG